MAIFQILYASGATSAFREHEIDDILEKSRANNARLDVTGMLLYANGAFIQVLEGDRRTVRTLADRISGDGRHRNFMVLYEGEARERAFADWQMGFRKLDPAREQDGKIFEATREALDRRIAGGSDSVMLDMVLAFSRDFITT